MSSFSVGCELAQVYDPIRDVTIPTTVMYPTDVGEKQEMLGPFSISVARDAPPIAARSVVLISHGTGGTPASHRELARYLAAQGFVVGVPEHPGNHRNDDSRAGTPELLQDRPRDLKAVVDWFFSQSRFAATIEQPIVSIVGHSLGAYTGLALAGGVPTSLPHQHVDRVARRVEVEPEPRLAALVLLAPAVPWFRQRGALLHVHAPILMIASYHDAMAPYFVMCPIVQEGVADPSAVDCRLVEDANHYSFLSPWPEAMRTPAIPPSQDPPGFDRRAFLDGLYPQIASFLVRATQQA
jgi:predicted dienelactone hydrolase